MKQGLTGYPLSLKGASMLPSAPHNSLVELRITGPQSIDILGSSDSSLLSSSFPSLNSLQLLEYHSQYKEEHIARLPPTLRYLKLTTRHASTLVLPSFARMLPRSLEELSLPHVRLVQEISDTATSESNVRVDWPLWPHSAAH